MPVTELSLQTVTRDGLEATYAAANSDGGNFFDNSSERVILHVKNGHSSPVVASIGATVPTIDGRALAAKTVTITNAEERFIGPFPKSIYNDASDDVLVTFDTYTSVTIAALKVPAASY